ERGGGGVMALEIGRFDVEIQSHSLRTIGDKDAASIVFKTAGGEEGRALIFLTERSMGIARRSLKLCGLDLDKCSLADLQINQTLLAGNHVWVLIEEWNGKMRAQIDTNGAPEEARIKQLDKMLKD